MCWSAPVSLATFISSSLMSAYLWNRNITNDKPFAIFIMCFSLMQLFEFFMWSDMKDHSFSSKLALIFIFLQPFSLVAGLYYFRPTLYKQLWEKAVLLGVGVLSLLKASVAAYNGFVTDADKKWLSVKGKRCHLVWSFIKNNDKMPQLARVDNMYILLLLLAMLMIKPIAHALFFVFLTFGACLYTKKYYPGENGSLWCWIANIIALTAIAAPYLKL